MEGEWGRAVPSLIHPHVSPDGIQAPSSTGGCDCDLIDTVPGPQILHHCVVPLGLDLHPSHSFCLEQLPSAWLAPSLQPVLGLSECPLVPSF